MPKKIIRLNEPKTSQISMILGRDVNLVMKIGNVYFGIIESVEKEIVSFRDKIGTKHIFKLGDISEVVYDEVV